MSNNDAIRVGATNGDILLSPNLSHSIQIGQMTRTKLRLNVKALIEFAARTGDLFAERQVGPTAMEGIAGHQKIQQSRNSQWQAEYRLKQTISIGQFDVTLQGRVDLLNAEVTPAIIEEIKTCYQPPALIQDSKKQLHWAQAKVYAYLFYLDQHLDQHLEQHLDQQTPEDESCIVRISWYDLTTKQLHSDDQHCDAVELKRFTYNLLNIYLDWIEKFTARRLQTVTTAKQLQFPFDGYRSGQYDFARTVYCTIRDKKSLLAQAPTGTGKTISTLFPAIKAVGEKHLEQIVYLTAKGSVQGTVRDSLHLLQGKGLKMDYLLIQAKDKTCPCRSNDEAVKQSCDSDSGQCSRTVDFFDRLPEARLACLDAWDLSPDKLGQIAEQHHICPFELCLQMVRWSCVVICDVNYLFDPLVGLAAFDDNKSKRALLVDEVHNLPERARQMYSAALSASQSKAIGRQLTAYPQLKKRCQSLARALTALVKSPEPLTAPPPSLTRSIELLMDTLGEVDAGGNDVFVHPPEGLSDWLKALYRYLTISQLYGDSHVTLLNQRQQGKYKETTLRLICLDGAEFLTEKYQSARAMVGFSATLNPMPFYLRLLGLAEGSLTCRLPAAFPIENQLTLRCDYIDTRWAHRAGSITPLVELILTVFTARAGKYLVFFPSYQYLNDVYQQFELAQTDIKTIKQVSGADEAERQRFLDAFFQGDESTIGFAIMGGIFGEGVDFAGDALTGAIVIGTGMPQPNEELKLMEAHYQRQGLNSFAFVSQFPGFTRVQQTAGRVIRSETDRGVVVLVDPRFKRFDYQQLMPEHWQVMGCKNQARVRQVLEDFWGDFMHAFD